MKTSIPRLRRIRFKDGRTIEVLRRPEDSDVASRLRGSMIKSVDYGSEVVGFALIVWYANGEVFPATHNGVKSPLLAGQVAQYVKDVILADTAARWVEGD